MKSNGMIITMFLLCWLGVGAQAAEPVEPNYAGITAWVMGGNEFRELRVGWQHDWIEGVLAVNHRGAIETKKATEDLLGIRAYLFVHAVDANMVATWFGAATPLPKGTLYLGPYVGWEFADENFEWGIVAGGQVALNRMAAFIAEYQRAIEDLANQNRDMFLAGLRIYFPK